MGDALGAFFTINVSISRSADIVEWGPGANVRCSQPYLVILASPSTSAVVGAWLLGPNNTSDFAEPPSTFIFGGSPGQIPTLLFDNAFQGSNLRNISTCGQPAQSYPGVSSDYLKVSFPITFQGEHLTVPFMIPVDESYHYWFPGNFGTWQVDNLSAPGGPGGGWAFSYSPCS
jgi:hypothetical protein